MAILQELEAAASSSDADTVELAVRHAYEEGLRPEFVPALLALLRQTNHTRHEDIVSALQQLKDARSVDTLFEAASIDHEYLSYDESFGLARKCTWALADIGTREAKSRLEALARQANPVIAGYAQKRLDRWDYERQRKG